MQSLFSQQHIFMHPFSIAIHGGAGTILKEEMTEELETSYREGLNDAMLAGYAVLETGGSALMAVTAATKCLEDNILFNAGRGSVFTNAGTHEMDASIMDGSNLDAGAVSAVSNIRNPIEAALLVMQQSQHVFLCGEGAETFAKNHGLALAADDYFFSPFRYEQWQAIKNSDEIALDHSQQKEKKFGTVGAVACDTHGNIAAATSTGGMTNKKFGRIGDSPIIGSGTYANNATCAISCTGHGEIFMRAVAAYDVSCLMEYGGLGLHEAMQIVVHDKLVKMGGEGGMIGVDANANIAMMFNSPGMYRAAKSNAGYEEISIYVDPGMGE